MQNCKLHGAFASQNVGLLSLSVSRVHQLFFLLRFFSSASLSSTRSLFFFLAFNLFVFDFFWIYQPTSFHNRLQFHSRRDTVIIDFFSVFAEQSHTAGKDQKIAEQEKISCGENFLEWQKVKSWQNCAKVRKFPPMTKRLFIISFCSPK